MTKTAATKEARKLVSQLLPIGRQWYYNTYDERVQAWRQGNPRHFFQARADRARYIRVQALILMGHGDDEAEYLADAA